MTRKMTEAQHYEKHRDLHKALDELVGDWIQSTGNRPSEYTILALMQWSAIQVQNEVEQKCPYCGKVVDDKWEFEKEQTNDNTSTD